MKKIFFALLIIYGVSATAQDKKATTILNEVSEKTRSYENIKIEFEYKMINKVQKINETMEGTLLSKGDKYKLDVAGQIVISDGKTMWTYLESVNEVQINEASDNDEGFNPRTFLQTWQDKFRAKMLNETANDAQIELIPKEPATFSKVHVKVDKAKKHLTSITMFDSNGSEFVYSIRRFITNQAIPDKEFTFNTKDYPGIEVIDLR